MRFETRFIEGEGAEYMEPADFDTIIEQIQVRNIIKFKGLKSNSVKRYLYQ